MATPPEDKFAHIPFGPQRCRHVGGHVLDALEAELRTAAERNGGSISLGEIEAITDHIRQTPRGVWAFYKESFSGCFAASRSAAPQGYERTDLFFRLVAMTFEKRFADHVAADDSGPLLSRAIVAPFTAALEVMLGKDDLSAYRTACDEIYDDLLRVQGDRISWPAFYAAPRSREILRDACAKIAHHFTDFEARMAWLVEVLNRNTESPDARPRDTGVTEFTDRDALMLFACLFEGCRGAPDNDAVAALLARLDETGLRRYAAEDAG